MSPRQILTRRDRILFAARLAGLALILSLAASELALAAGDPARGAGTFQACAVCHSTTPGEHMTGPSLAKIWQHRAGTVEDFQRYSEAMTRAKLVWTEQTLDKWLANPEAFIPGTSMSFQGLRESKARQDVIAYLKAVSEGKAPANSPRSGGMMMNMQPSKVDLKNAPPEGQVAAIGYCGDTYTVRTADGKVEKVWEFNLRLKTDSSTLGPRPGKPVIVGAGMQGDRAAVIFAAPSEISAFIRPECPERK
jgi:cytochrome c